MKDVVKVGEELCLHFVVQPTDVASFPNQMVHSVYSTFALARDVEWTTRQFVLRMKDAHEEGIGTLLQIRHVAPAFVGETVSIKGRVEKWEGSELICSFEAHVGTRLIASGMTGQKVLPQNELNNHFARVRSGASDKDLSR